MRHPEKKIPPSRKKRVWLLIPLLVAALAIVFLLPNLLKEKAPEAGNTVYENPVKSLQSGGAGAIVSIRIMPEGEEPYTLVNRNGTFLLETEEGLEAITSSVSEDLMDMFTSLTIQDTIAQNAEEVQGEWEDMGLSTPRSRAEVRYEDGSAEVAELGAAVPETSYSYFRWSGAEGVYACDQGMTDALLRPSRRLISVEQPEMEPSLAEKMILTRDGEKWVIRFEGNDTGNPRAFLDEPFAYPLSADSAESLLGSLEGLLLGTPLEKGADGGFDQPLMTVEILQAEGLSAEVNEEGGYYVTQVPSGDYLFVFGKEEKDYFLTCRFGDTEALVNRFQVRYLLETPLKDLLTRNPFSLGEKVASLTLENGEDVFRVEVTREKTGEDEEEETVSSVTLNGESKSAEWLSELEEVLEGITVSGAAAATYTPAEEPVWRLTLKGVGGAERELQGWRQDAFFQAFSLNGEIRHCLYVEELEKLLRLLEG